MEKHRKGQKFPVKTEAGIASAYEMGGTIDAICGEFNCSRDTVYRVIKDYNISTRNKYPRNSVRRK